MGLSESEKRVLEELERGLYAEDAAFERKSKAQIERIEAPGANSPSKVIAGSLIAVVGISILVFGAVTQVALFGVLGFLVEGSSRIKAFAKLGFRRSLEQAHRPVIRSIFSI